MGEDERWKRVEDIFRRVMREELAALGFKPKARISFTGGELVGITPDVVKAWRASYGSVDIDKELNRAAAWIASNPSKAPKREVSRFLNSWLAREQDRASIRAIPNVTSILTKSCAYCGKPATGSVNGYDHCSAHAQSAMDGERPFQMRQRA